MSYIRKENFKDTDTKTNILVFAVFLIIIYICVIIVFK